MFHRSRVRSGDSTFPCVTQCSLSVPIILLMGLPDSPGPGALVVGPWGPLVPGRGLACGRLVGCEYRAGLYLRRVRLPYS